MNADRSFFSLASEAEERDTVSRIASGSDVVDGGLFDSYSSNLRKAVDAVYHGANSDTANMMRANVSRFAAYKAATVTADIRNEMHSTGSETDAVHTLRQYNTFQTTEYNTATARARTGKQWEKFMDKDNLRLFPNLRWLPSRSAEPRELHRQFWNRVWAKDDPFWNNNQPGNLWNCKCDWEETMDGVTDSTPKGKSPAKSAMPGLEGNPGTGVIFSDNASYIRNSARKPQIVAATMNVGASATIKAAKGYLLGTSRNAILAGNKCTLTFNSTTIKHFCKSLKYDEDAFWLKNTVIERDIYQLFDNLEEPKVYASDLGAHNTNPDTVRLKRATDFFYYYKKVLPSGKVVYLVFGRYAKTGEMYFYDIVDMLP